MIRPAAFIPGLAAASAAIAAASTLYVPPEGDFSVAFPAAPTILSQPAQRSHNIGRRRYVEQEPTRVLMVAIDDYPDGELPQSADEAVYDRLLRDRAEDENARLTSTRAARLAGRPCLEGLLVRANGVVEEVRVLMVGDRIYQLTYVRPGDVEPDGADTAFFASFRITPGGSAASR